METDDAPRPYTRSQAVSAIVIGLVLMVASLPGLAITVDRMNRLHTLSARVPGKIIGYYVVRPETNDKDRGLSVTYVPRFQFSTPDGTGYEGYSAIARPLCPWPSGQDVTVAYQPDKPGNADVVQAVRRQDPLQLVGYVLFGAGCIFVGGGLWTMRSLRREAEAPVPVPA